MTPSSGLDDRSKRPHPGKQVTKKQNLRPSTQPSSSAQEGEGNMNSRDDPGQSYDGSKGATALDHDSDDIGNRPRRTAKRPTLLDDKTWDVNVITPIVRKLLLENVGIPY